jgi:LPXTG-motif cell wall-anchored protein
VTIRSIHLLQRSALPGLAAAAFGAVVLAVLVFSSTSARAAAAPVGLGTAGSFSVLAGSTVTNTGASTLAQNLGVHPGSAAPGFPPGLVSGETHLGDAVALQAQSDLTTAYTDAAGRTPFTSVASELGGTTLTPGVYRVGAAQLTGTLTLNAQGNSQAVFIFQISSALTTASNSKVVFTDGNSSCNVFWQITSSATLGTGTAFIGNIMALTSITMATGATLEGRALARNGTVTLDDNVITALRCTQPTTSPSASPSASRTTSPSTSSTVTHTTTSAVTSSTSPGVLPTTGNGSLSILVGTGIVLVLAGGATLLLYRRRSAED